MEEKNTTILNNLNGEKIYPAIDAEAIIDTNNGLNYNADTGKIGINFDSILNTVLSKYTQELYRAGGDMGISHDFKIWSADIKNCKLNEVKFPETMPVDEYNIYLVCSNINFAVIEITNTKSESFTINVGNKTRWVYGYKDLNHIGTNTELKPGETVIIFIVDNNWFSTLDIINDTNTIVSVNNITPTVNGNNFTVNS